MVGNGPSKLRTEDDKEPAEGEMEKRPACLEKLSESFKQGGGRI